MQIYEYIIIYTYIYIYVGSALLKYVMLEKSQVLSKQQMSRQDLEALVKLSPRHHVSSALGIRQTLHQLVELTSPVVELVLFLSLRTNQ